MMNSDDGGSSPRGDAFFDDSDPDADSSPEADTSKTRSSSISDHEVPMDVDASVNASDGSDKLREGKDPDDEEDEIDDDEMPMVIDEGPTGNKKARIDPPQRSPFRGFPYDPATSLVIHGFSGLLPKSIQFGPLNRVLLDMNVPVKTLPKLKITLPRRKSEQRKVSTEEDFEPPKPVTSNHTASDVPVRKNLVVATNVAPDARVERPTEKALGSGSQSVLIVTPTPPRVRESREWKPSLQYIKPLNAGWIREVVFDREEDGKYKSKPREVNYFSPCKPGGIQKKFQAYSELQPYLKSINSEFSLANFSFRMEPMNAMNGQEVLRASDETPPFPLEPTKPVELLPAGVKRRHSAIEILEQQQESPKNASKNKSGPKVKTFGNLGSPAISNVEFSSPKPKDKIFPKEREPKSSEKGSLIYKVTKPNLNSPPSLSSPKVTITPAIKTIAPPKSTPTVSISLPQKQWASLGPTPNSHASGNKLNSNTFSNKILRPIKPTTQSCSIHCPKSASLPPELTCNGCLSFFHLVCIGFEEQVDYSTFDFYCNVCSPPIEKENNRPRSIVSPTIPTIKSSQSMLIGQKRQNVSDDSTPPSEPWDEENQVTNSPLDVDERPTPPRPIETQAIVNIGGIKYLAMPRDKGNVCRNSPVLLQPAKDGSHPSYEVVEGPDGKLTLTKVTTSNGTPTASKKVMAPDGCFLTSQIQRVSSDYFYGLLHVFQYLTIAELCNAAQVCKLWNEVSQHHSLWTSVSLSRCQMKNWDRFLSVMEKKAVEHIDFKKLVVDENEESSWIEHLNQSISKLKNVRRVEFLNITPSGLENFVNELYKEKGSRLSNIISLDIVSGEQPKALDFSILGNVNHLEELQISSAAGPLKLLNFSRGLSIFGWKFATTLKVLCVLNADSLTDDHVNAISELKNLEKLEIGSCEGLSREFLTYFAKLEKLQSLRLERAITGDELGVLSTLKDLQNLELIDNEFKPGFHKGFELLQSVTQLMLIPAYTEKPGTINRNLVDGLAKMNNIERFFLGFTKEWLASLKPADIIEEEDVIPLQDGDDLIYISLPKFSKRIQNVLPITSKVKLLKMWQRSTSRQNLTRRKP